MSEFGNILFGGSRFIRWSLTPVILFFALWLPTMTHKMAPTGMPVFIGVEIVFVAMLAGFWLPAKIGQMCFRVVAAIVFLAFTTAVIDAFASAKPSSTRRLIDQPSPYSLLMGLVIVGIPSLRFALTGGFSLRSEPSEEELAAARNAVEETLLQPDWDFYERHLERPVPQALRSLYADAKLITSSLLDYSDKCSINSFEPLKEDFLIEVPEVLEFPIVAIATDAFGDPIYLRPGSAETDAVYVTYHDGGDTETLADSVAAFVERLKEVNKPDAPNV